MSRKGTWMLAAAAVITIGLASYAMAQDAGGARRQRPGGGGDPAQARQQMLDGIKKTLGATDDEWRALQPKVEKVLQAQRDARAGGMMGRRGPSGGAPAPEGQPAPQQSDVQKASDALRKALEDKEANTDEIKTALTAYREARAKAKTNLETAQKDLKGVVTVRQEAQLVDMGLLE